MGPDLLPVDYNVPPALKPEPGGRRWPVAVPAPRRRAEADAELARRARATLNRLPWSAEIEAEDARRQRAVEARCALFDPFIGRFPEGAPERRVDVDAGFVRSRCPKLGYADTLEQALDGVASCPVAIPESMANDPALGRVGSRREWQLLRFRHDFAYWAATCVSIKDKCRGRRVRFVLNYAQRRLLAAFERQRLAGRPIRTILLKARQWGGSTMTQMYMMWIQSVLTTDWNSLICTQVSHISAGIRGMLSQTLAEYPQELWLDECGDDDEEDAGGAEVPSRSKSRKKKKRKLCLAPYEGQREVRTIPGRRCNVTTASARNQDAARIAAYYNRALLVFESNTLESADRPGSDAPEQGAYILHTLYDHYPNLYMRQSPDGSGPARPGFHTNRQTKQMIITELIAAVRDGSYVERDHHTADEMNVYQLMPNGSYCARRGYHDDCIMTRAIALHVARSEQARPFSLSQNPELARFIGAQLGRIKAH